MHIAKKAHIATLAVLATVLFTGCAAAESSPSSGSTPKATAEETPASQTPEEIFIENATKGTLGVAVIEVIDPRTFVVGPNSFEQDHNKLAGEMTVSIRPESTLVTPAEGECGYDESLAFATQYFADNPENAYVKEGHFGSEEYLPDLIRAGFGYVPNPQGNLEIPQDEAQNLKSGLWTICPGFGV